MQNSELQPQQCQKHSLDKFNKLVIKAYMLPLSKLNCIHRNGLIGGSFGDLKAGHVNVGVVG